VERCTVAATQVDARHLNRPRDNPSFALKNRRPEAYDELVVRQREKDLP